MSEFERIVREALVMGGQARIRDTNITVNEIVRLALAGRSQADILGQYPKLEAEDVHQALGYVVQQTSGLQVNSMQEMNPEISAIEGFASMLEAGFSSGDITPEFSMKKIISLIKSLKFKKMYYVLRARLLYPWYRKERQATEIQAIQKEIHYYLAPDIPIPAIHISHEIESYLIDSELIPILGFLTQQKTDSTISVKESDGSILFRVDVHHFERKDEPLVSSIELAASVIHEIGSELKVKQERDTVIFEFALPIVDEDKD